MINDGEDRVVSIGLGEADNEVHGYLLEREGGRVHGDFVHHWACAVCDDFVLLARRTSLDVFCNPRTHVWPPVVPLGLSDRFIAARVSSYKAFVYDPHDLSFECTVGRDCQLSLFPPSCDFTLRWF